jgi:Protein of unknown function with PCYCGC motif
MSSGRTSRACLVALALALGAVGCDSNSSEPPVSAQQAPAPAPAAPVAPPAPVADAGAATAAAPPADQWETRAPSLSDADIPPLPTAPFPLARPEEVVRAVYVFAAKHPEVLSHVPCFCGCESRGHKHNDDCFVMERDAKGRPTKWEPHGLG